MGVADRVRSRALRCLDWVLRSRRSKTWDPHKRGFRRLFTRSRYLFDPSVQGRVTHPPYFFTDFVVELIRVPYIKMCTGLYHVRVYTISIWVGSPNFLWHTEPHCTVYTSIICVTQSHIHEANLDYHFWSGVPFRGHEYDKRLLSPIRSPIKKKVPLIISYSRYKGFRVHKFLVEVLTLVWIW